MNRESIDRQKRHLGYGIRLEIGTSEGTDSFQLMPLGAKRIPDIVYLINSMEEFSRKNPDRQNASTLEAFGTDGIRIMTELCRETLDKSPDFSDFTPDEKDVFVAQYFVKMATKVLELNNLVQGTTSDDKQAIERAMKIRQMKENEPKPNDAVVATEEVKQ